MNPEDLKLAQERIQYSFKNQFTLETALTHRSCLNEPGTKESYERLEFLGDAVLEMMISSYLFLQYPDKMEGYLTSARSAIVRTESLSEIAKTLNLGPLIRLSKGEEAGGGRNNPSILEDIIESLIGAIYIDGGLQAATSFFTSFVIPKASIILSEDRLRDAKSRLQETIQSQNKPSPVYKVVREIGPDHDKTFESAVFINNKQISSGIGKSKQEAEQKAAQTALELV